MQKTCNKNLEDLLGTKQHKETVDETNLDTEEWQSFTAVAATGDREEKDIVGDRINGILTEEQRERNEDKEYDSKSRPQDWQSLPFLKAEKISRWEKIGKSLTFYLFLFNQEDFNSLTFELIEKIWNKVRWGQLYKGLTSVKTGENLSSSDATIEVDYRPVRYARATTVGLLSNPVGANTDTTGEKLFKERQDMSKADLSQSCLVEFHESAKSYDSDKPANLNTWVRDNAYKNVRRDSIISDNYQSNGKREFVHKRPFSVRGKEYQEVSGEISEEKYQQLQYTEEYLKYQNPGSASNFRPRAGLRDDFKYRFEKAVSDLPARQRQAINLYRFDPDCETWKDVAERIPNREGDGKGVSTKWLRHGIRKPAMETLAKKFPERVGSYVKDPIDDSYISEEKLAGVPIAFITDQIYKFTCNCSPVGKYEFIKETREMTCPNCGREMKGEPIEWERELAEDPEEEPESDRIKAGFRFGDWPTDSEGHELLYANNTKFHTDTDAYQRPFFRNNDEWREAWRKICSNTPEYIRLKRCKEYGFESDYMKGKTIIFWEKLRKDLDLSRDEMAKKIGMRPLFYNQKLENRGLLYFKISDKEKRN